MIYFYEINAARLKDIWLYIIFESFPKYNVHVTHCFKTAHMDYKNRKR